VARQHAEGRLQPTLYSDFRTVLNNARIETFFPAFRITYITKTHKAMYYTRIDYLRKSVQELLNYGYSDAYIEAVLYTGAYSITEIQQAIIDVKSMQEV
jgi:hypothetical protein